MAGGGGPGGGPGGGQEELPAVPAGGPGPGQGGREGWPGGGVARGTQCLQNQGYKSVLPRMAGQTTCNRRDGSEIWYTFVF